MNIPDLLRARDLTHRGGMYTVGFTRREDFELFQAFVVENPANPLRYPRANRQNLRGNFID